MIDNILMLVVLIFIAATTLVGIKIDSSDNHFFSKDNTLALRGIWCLVILLVHVPYAYHNRIQDMIGSFAYIGVTFFFLSSGYGLTTSENSNQDMITGFWKKRLPKLLITCWAVNIFSRMADYILFRDRPSILALIKIDEWVIWLIGCYLIFWISHKLFFRSWKTVTIMAVVLASIVFYMLSKTGTYTLTIWATECYGFIWGITLAELYSKIKQFFTDKWLLKWMVSLLLSLLLGISYLVLKPVPFFGDYLLKIILGLSITLFILIANVRFSIGNRLSLFLGSITLEMYLLHTNVFNIISRLFPAISSGLFIISSIIVTIIAAAIIHFLLGKIFSLPVCKTC